MKLGRTVLGVVAMIFIAFGVWALLDPVAVAGLTQVELPTPTAGTAETYRTLASEFTLAALAAVSLARGAKGS